MSNYDGYFVCKSQHRMFVLKKVIIILIFNKIHCNFESATQSHIEILLGFSVKLNFLRSVGKLCAINKMKSTINKVKT